VPTITVKRQATDQLQDREDTGLGSDHALLEFHLVGQLFSGDIMADGKDDRPNTEGVAAMVEDTAAAAVCEPADRLLQDIDDDDRVTIHDITSLASPLTDETVAE